MSSNKTGYIIEGFAGISASQLVSVQVSVENPPVAVAYKIQIFSYSTSYNAQIDEAYTSITIENNYGSSKFFKSHALEWTTRLGHGETGPLEFTFFLNIPLPATYSSFEGHLVVDIRPQIPTPPQGTSDASSTIRSLLNRAPGTSLIQPRQHLQSTLLQQKPIIRRKFPLQSLLKMLLVLMVSNCQI